MLEAHTYQPEDIDHLMDVDQLTAGEARALIGHEKNDIDNPPTDDSVYEHGEAETTPLKGYALAKAIVRGEVAVEDLPSVQETTPAEDVANHARLNQELGVIKDGDSLVPEKPKR